MILRATGVLVILEASIIFFIQVVSVIRKRNRQEGSFPHLNMEEGHIRENTVQIYDYGRDLYDTMLAAIDSAQESVYLETYIWKGDATGQEFKDKLARKASQGVEVYAIFDRFANLVVPHSFKVFPPDMHVLQYHAFTRPWHIFDPRRYALDHRKLLVVDGNTAFIGGYNLAACTPQPGEIHTYAFRVLLRPILPNHLSTSGLNTPLILITSSSTTPAASIRLLPYGEIVLYGSHFPYPICISKRLTRHKATFYSP